MDKGQWRRGLFRISEGASLLKFKSYNSFTFVDRTHDLYRYRYRTIISTIIQGSGVGPTFYIVMKSDLSTLSSTNILSKYADDIDLLVPQYCDIDLATEFDNIQRWATDNNMIINRRKTKEIVFRRPCPLRFNFVSSVDVVALVDHVMSLGVILQQSFFI